MRGQVATEQERVLLAKETEFEEAQSNLVDLRNRLREEETRRESADIQVAQLKASLEEAKRTIENNENSKFFIFLVLEITH